MKEQFYLYSVDTKAFYTEEEQSIDKQKYESIKEVKHICQSTIDNYNYVQASTIKAICNNEYITKQEKDLNKKIQNNHNDKVQTSRIKHVLNQDDLYVQAKNEAKTKAKILAEQIENFIGIRELNKKSLNDFNRVSLFSNSFSRNLGIIPYTTITDIIIVRVYHYKVLEQLICNGFVYEGEKYRVFTASAGQIRTKKVIFVKESIWSKYEKTVMCGLTTDSINSSKERGCNVTKFLAYLALCNSATDEIVDFDIDRSIVIEDFENVVVGEVDYIDNKTFEITRKVMGVPINQSDGCGWISPRVNMKNFMIRLPWIKGLMTPVNYIKFANENNCSTIVKDIYGKEHDLKNVDYVFTKSQFKMWKYYDSWEEYQEYFKKYNCSANMCNLEPNASEFKNASLNYQMWQTLTDITDEEIKSFTSNVEELVSNGYSKRKTMIELLGADSSNKNKTSLQKCIEIYPELINLKYVKEKLASMLNARKKEAKYGKFKINGKYTFVVPDVVAWMEHVFGLEVKGHLLGNEVSCKLYKKAKELIANRSPHLYREWGVRSNKEPSKWYLTNAIYVSVFDLISKLLQLDCDGDKLLVIDNPKLINIAKRNMEGIVPLYYEMGKANAQIINTQSIYNSLIQAFKFNNIGKFSNKLTVMWNNDEIDIPTIAQLTALNNFTIDAAKTLLVPEVPIGVGEKMKASNGKLPYFMQFAKDKHVNDVASMNNSTVNRICKNIESINNKYLRFNMSEFCEFEIKYLLFDKRTKFYKDKNVLNKLDELYVRYKSAKAKNRYSIEPISDEVLRDELRYKFEEFCNIQRIDIRKAVDYLVIDLLEKPNVSENKTSLLFDVFGDIIYLNMENNVSVYSNELIEKRKSLKKKLTLSNKRINRKRDI